MTKSNNIELVINPDRFNYLLDLYKINYTDFAAMLNEGRKKDRMNGDQLESIVKNKNVSIKLLKRIDKVFIKGLTWYLTKRDLPERKSSSIFFRKDKFNSELKLESKKIVNKYEELKSEIQILCRNINYEAIRVNKYYSLEDRPEIISNEIIKQYETTKITLMKKNVIKAATEEDHRKYLINTIRIFEAWNIFTFELLETWNKKEKVEFNGFFIDPNIIVLKKQKHIKREIFTLCHEFAHYLLNLEEIDEEVDYNVNVKLNKVEKWCSDFSFYFLLGESKSKYEEFIYANKSNNYYKNEIDEICNKTHLSHMAVYTKLRIENKISQGDYENKIKELWKHIEDYEKNEKKKWEIKKQELAKLGKEPFVVIKPIESTLFKEIVKVNYFQGSINELALREYLNIKPDTNIEKVIY